MRKITKNHNIVKRLFLATVLLSLVFQVNAQNWVFTSPDRATLNPTSANLGIGTTTPSAKLHVVNSQTATSMIVSNSQAATTAMYGIRSVVTNSSTTSTSDSYGIHTQVTSKNRGTVYGNYARVFNDNSSNTANIYGAYFDVESDYSSAGTVYGVYSEVYGGAKKWAGYFTGGDLYVSGNVGIGITNPTEKLDVSGNIKATKLSVVGGLTSFSTNNLILQTDNNTRMTILNSNGNVGIGITAPTERLDVSGNIKGTKLITSSGITSNGATNLALQTNNTTQMIIYSNGNVGIGTGTSRIPTNKLEVNGVIRAHEVIVETTNWPDYVFAPDYHLPTLQEVARHIEEKQHLPGIPSAAEVAEEGINLSEMNVKLLQKIEELTLYVIQQEERIKALETNNK
jgi:hypothetical protein